MKLYFCILFFAAGIATIKGSCEKEKESFSDCLNSELPQVKATNCDPCVAGYIPDTFETCQDLERNICDGIKSCGCDSCADEFETYLDCVVEENTGCQVRCDLDYSDDIDDNDKGSCEKEKDDMYDCLHMEISVVRAQNCESCVANSIPDTFESCQDTERKICDGIKSCGCDSCADEVEAYLDCVVDAGTTGCQIRCGTGRYNSAASSIFDGNVLVTGGALAMAAAGATLG